MAFFMPTHRVDLDQVMNKKLTTKMKLRIKTAFPMLLLLVLAIGGIILWFKDNCSNFQIGRCQFLWGMFFAIFFGSILLLELLHVRRKERGEWYVWKEDFEAELPRLSGGQVWLRSVLRIALTTLLLGLPIIFQGAFVVTLTGAIAGLALDLFVRAIMNKLPPIIDDEAQPFTEEDKPQLTKDDGESKLFTWHDEG